MEVVLSAGRFSGIPEQLSTEEEKLAYEIASTSFTDLVERARG